MVHVGDIAKGGSPAVYTDFVVGFQASVRKPIDYDKILRLIYWLRDTGFNLAAISYDAYQSQHSMHASRAENRPKMPVEEKQLVDPDYAKFDNIFIDP